MKKYLKNGQEVEVIKEIDGGYLYQFCYSNDYSDDDVWIDEDVTYFTETLYDNPPVNVLHSEVKSLQDEITKLQEERNKIRELKNSEKGLLTEIKQRDFIQGLVDYLNGDFKYVLYVEDMEIIEKQRVYISPFIKITNTKGSGFSLFTLRSENYDSYDDRAIMVFKTFDEAQKYAKNKLIDKLKYNTEKSNYKWSSGTIKDWFNKINSTCKLKDDPDIMKIYTDKFESAKQKEDEEKRIKLQKEIEEKQNALKTIS